MKRVSFLLVILMLVTLACQVPGLPGLQATPPSVPPPTQPPLATQPPLSPPAVTSEPTTTRVLFPPTLTPTPTLSKTTPAAAKPTSNPPPAAGIPTLLSPTPNSTAVWAKKQVENRLPEALLALRLKDMKRLSALVHPKLGVRFSPYSFVKASDRVYTAAQLVNAMNDTTRFQWGAYDGTGQPITLTFSEYYSKFVYSREFSAAPVVSFNQAIGKGNLINNSSAFYPTAIIVEYHYPGFDPKYEGMDWESLRLVFDYLGGKWYLIGIIHASWTI